MKTIAIIGTVGIPSNYGGFETLAENLVRYHHAAALPGRLVVYCSAQQYRDQPASYLGAQLRYVKFDANGISSIFYDIVSLFSAVRQRCDVILLLGVSGALVLPLVRLVSTCRIVTNIDGIEWKRQKWKGAARWFLRLSERIAVHFSHEVIADNEGIARYVVETYGRKSQLIAYGGDHAIAVEGKPYNGACLPDHYALALCRIEPENNVTMILKAYALRPSMSLVFVGNWNNSAFGRELRQRFACRSNLHLLDPIYDLGVLRTLRENASTYVHGHSAGGTNPSLVEMMHFGIPILAYDCIFNQYTTDGKALWFADIESICTNLDYLVSDTATKVGGDMLRIAQERYRWSVIGQTYFNLLLSDKQQ